jgi:pimeloyl-ACP methyl ester carboxylesterase
MATPKSSTTGPITGPFAAETAGDPAAPMLFFMHGWPDNASLWRKQFAALSGQFYCVAVSMPNFGDRAEKAGGHDFPRLVEGLAATLRQYQQRGHPVTLVTHDWGAYLGYMLQRRYPELVDRMVALDIGGHARPNNFKEAVFTIAYQWALVLCWWVGGVLPPLGNLMARGVGKVVRVPRRQRANMRSRQCYPYFYFWRGMLFSRWKSSLLGFYKPGCPIYYLYGQRKPVMFHTERWLKLVEESGGRCEAVAGGGHWFMETHPDIVNRAIAEWCAPQAGTAQAGTRG